MVLTVSNGGEEGVDCKEMMEDNSKTEVEDSEEEEEEEPHLTWVNKYDRPMPQVGSWWNKKPFLQHLIQTFLCFVSFDERPCFHFHVCLFASLMIFILSGDLEVLRASRVPFVQVKNALIF